MLKLSIALMVLIASILMCSLTQADQRVRASESPALKEGYVFHHRLNAIVLTQGMGNQGKLNELAMQQVDMKLRAIVAKFPEVKDIHARPPHSLDCLSVTFVPIADRNEFDKLNKQYGASKFIDFPGLRSMTLNFPQDMDVPSLAEEYKKLACVRDAYPDPTVGDGNEIFYLRKNGDHLFVFKKGWGDCPSGCINNHFHYISYDPDTKKIKKHGELKNMQDAGFPLWGIPRRYTIKPFENYDDLIEKCKSEQWWVALHSLHVVGRLITTDHIAFGSESKDAFAKLKHGILANKQKSLAVYVDALSSKDDQVRDVAWQTLKHLSGKRYKATDVKSWKSWLDSDAARTFTFADPDQPAVENDASFEQPEED